MFKHRKVVWLVLFWSILVGCTVYYSYDTNVLRLHKAQVVEEKREDGEALFAFSEAAIILPDYHKEKISFFYNEFNDEYEIFLPGGENAKHQTLSYEDEMIAIDGKRYLHGDTLNLETGCYKINGLEHCEDREVTLRVLQSENIAATFISCDDDSEQLFASKDAYCSGRMKIYDTTGNMEYLEEIAEIASRGNVSFDYTDKKSFRINFVREVNLFHMGASRKWALIANAFDVSLMRNMIAYNIGGLAEIEYMPQAEYTDLYLDGKYMGNYILSEKPTIEKQRMNVRNLERLNELSNGTTTCLDWEHFREDGEQVYQGVKLPKNPIDISGTYLLSLELPFRLPYADSGFVTESGQPIVIASPVYASEEEVKYIMDYYQNFENALMDENGVNLEGESFIDYIEVDSFARKYLLEECLKNHDATLTSQYILKLSDGEGGKMKAGMPWDYDKTIGGEEEAFGYDLRSPEGLYAAQEQTPYDFWENMYKHQEFTEAVKKHYWGDIRGAIVEIAEDRIDFQKERIRASAYMNAYRWLGDENHMSEESIMVDFESEIAYIKDFLLRRVAFLDQEWG